MIIKGLIFDFDGVIAESNNVKTEAFVKLFRDYPRHIKESVRIFHLENGGMSRFDKFRYIYANFLKQPLPEKRFDELCTEFNRIVFDGVVNAPMVDGVEDFLRRNKNRYDMYVVSGTPQDEIRAIVQRRRLGDYFIGVYGSPSSKKDLIRSILQEKHYNPKEVVFLGDSINDYEGAKGAGIGFIAKISYDLGVEQFPGAKLKIKIKKIAELEKYLNEKK